MQPLANERDLIARAKTGDREAVSTLYEGYTQAIFRYISYRVETDALAEDLTAEVFLRMVRGLPKYEDSGAPFGAWLYRIAATQIAEHYRRKRRAPAEPISDSQPSDDTDPFGKSAKAEERERLRTALAALPADYQTLLVMRFMQELSHETVAQVLNKSEGAIRVMQHRALKALAQQLGQESKARSYQRGEG
ncbi:MAG: sigma-70 family RNA polymerase sigma factor [Anaerolineae bacterium]|nr:sigma-70 family RNA polymerase sigma factor [Anaerolineae bacterium]